jgi:dGTP triphosphohydrolase
VLDVLEKDGEGLNLTWEVLDGIANHSMSRMPSTLEGQVVRLSDKMAYIHHDIDDAIRGHVIAEEDLRQRGPGDLFGVRQSGEMNFKVGDIYHDSDLVKESAMDADRILFADPDLSLPQHAVLKEVLNTKSVNLVDFTTL